MALDFPVGDLDPDDKGSNVFGYVGIASVVGLSACMAVAAEFWWHFMPASRGVKVAVADSFTHNVGLKGGAWMTFSDAKRTPSTKGVVLQSPVPPSPLSPGVAVPVPLGVPPALHLHLPDTETQTGRICVHRRNGDDLLLTSVSMHKLCGLHAPSDGEDEGIVYRDGSSFYDLEKGKEGDLDGELSCASTGATSFRFIEGPSFCVEDGASLDGSDLFREGPSRLSLEASFDDLEVGSTSTLSGTASSRLREGASFCRQ